MCDCNVYDPDGTITLIDVLGFCIICGEKKPRTGKLDHFCSTCKDTGWESRFCGKTLGIRHRKLCQCMKLRRTYIFHTKGIALSSTENLPWYMRFLTYTEHARDIFRMYRDEYGYMVGQAKWKGLPLKERLIAHGELALLYRRLLTHPAEPCGF